MSPPHSCVFEPEGNACSLTDSTAEEHVLALVEHAADEARDRISRLVPGGKVVPWGRPCHLPGAGLSARPSASGRCRCLAGALPCPAAIVARGVSAWSPRLPRLADHLLGAGVAGGVQAAGWQRVTLCFQAGAEPALPLHSGTSFLRSRCLRLCSLHGSNQA